MKTIYLYLFALICWSQLLLSSDRYKPLSAGGSSINAVAVGVSPHAGSGRDESAEAKNEKPCCYGKCCKCCTLECCNKASKYINIAGAVLTMSTLAAIAGIGYSYRGQISGLVSEMGSCLTLAKDAQPLIDGLPQLVNGVQTLLPATQGCVSGVSSVVQQMQKVEQESSECASLLQTVSQQCSLCSNCGKKSQIAKGAFSRNQLRRANELRFPIIAHIRGRMNSGRKFPSRGRKDRK